MSERAEESESQELRNKRPPYTEQDQKQEDEQINYYN